MVEKHVFTHRPMSRERQLLIGALFSGEYALESAALFNPSIVTHPDQGNLPPGALRFMMSLRATGEGHISSIEFRVGTISQNDTIEVLPASRYVTVPQVVQNPAYRKKNFVAKLHEMKLDDKSVAAVMEPLAENFTRSELNHSINTVKQEIQPGRGHFIAFSKASNGSPTRTTNCDFVRNWR